MRLILSLAAVVVVAPIARGEEYPSISRKPGSTARGVLINRSLGTSPCDPPDPSRPTLVVSHGLSLSNRRTKAGIADAVAETVAKRGGCFNVLEWDWNGDTFHSPIPAKNHLYAAEQGRKLACALRGAGIVRCQTTLVGHSLGCVVAASAARELAADGGGPVARLTLLEPLVNMHKLIFEDLGAAASAGCVENYWSPGVSGFGGPAPYPGVVNVRVEGPNRMFGLLVMRNSNHVYVGRMYAGEVGRTMPAPGCGH
jgi:pimeloyl-ACP methyl ester carboxylesterase